MTTGIYRAFIDKKISTLQNEYPNQLKKLKTQVSKLYHRFLAVGNPFAAFFTRKTNGILNFFITHSPYAVFADHFSPCPANLLRSFWAMSEMIYAKSA
jgi:hypothetical protein